MKVGDFFFEHGAYYVMEKINNAEQRIYYTAYYFYASHPDQSLHISYMWRTITEFNERFIKVEWNVFNKDAAKKMIIKTIKG